MLLFYHVYVYAIGYVSIIYTTFYFKVLRTIKSQNINLPSGAICSVFDNFFLRLIRIMKFSRMNTLYLFMFLRTNNCAITSIELLIVMNINLNGNTVGSFPIVSKISSSKPSENSPYVLTIVSSSRNAQWYLDNHIVFLSRLKKIEVDAFVNG